MAINARVVVLQCPWQHLTLWPVDLLPLPSTCFVKVASLPNGEWPTCGKALEPTGVFERVDNGSSNLLKDVEKNTEEG